MKIKLQGMYKLKKKVVTWCSISRQNVKNVIGRPKSRLKNSEKISPY